MTCRHQVRQGDFQPFPSRGTLADQMNLSLADIRERTRKYANRPVYVYVVKTVKRVDGELRQGGSAPNFQGGEITLCTCKHKDRASAPKHSGPDALDPWKGVWVAGITSVSECRPAALFYLMLVGATYASHQAMWGALTDPDAKSAFRDRYGDVYEPLPRACIDEYAAANYRPHLGNHEHNAGAREYDIQQTFRRRHPRLLQADPHFSFLWSRPEIGLAPDNDWGTAHHRFYKALETFRELLQ